MKWNDDSFVDLYDLLDVWPDAEMGALRRRIADLYLEARNNLEHQNHRKRFYYRELYEMQLPQARMILLDPERRAAYDQELQLFWKHKGKPTTSRKPKAAAPAKLDGLPGSGAPAPDDFSDFADIEDDALPPLQPPQFIMDRETVERRRDTKRRELIRHELVATGLRWALIGGLSAFLVSSTLVFIFHLALAPKSYLFYVFTIALIAAAVLLTGRQTMRWAKRRIIGMLSQMPYDELLRHCGGH